MLPIIPHLKTVGQSLANNATFSPMAPRSPIPPHTYQICWRHTGIVTFASAAEDDGLLSESEGDEAEELGNIDPLVRRSERGLLVEGARLTMEDRGTPGSTHCTIISVKDGPGGNSVLVFDDLYWGGYLTEELMTALGGAVKAVSNEDDVPLSRRPRFMLSPRESNAAGGSLNPKPDAFLLSAVSNPAVEGLGWVFCEHAVPAPANGDFGQKYGEPSRLGAPLSPGAEVTIVDGARVTPIMAAKKGDRKSSLNTETLFHVLGFVRGTLPTQSRYFSILVGPHGIKYAVNSIFLMKPTGGAELGATLLAAATHTVFHELSERSPAKVNSCLGQTKPCKPPFISPTAIKPASHPPGSPAPDSLMSNYELKRVGKALLSKMPIEHLVVIGKSRGIRGIHESLEPSLAVAKIEKWKRDRVDREDYEDDDDASAAKLPRRSRRRPSNNRRFSERGGRSLGGGLSSLSGSQASTTDAHDSDGGDADSQGFSSEFSGGRGGGRRGGGGRGRGHVAALPPHAPGGADWYDWQMWRESRREVATPVMSARARVATVVPPLVNIGPSADRPPLPPGWKQSVDRSTGRTYYYNKATGASTFDNPLLKRDELGSPPLPPPPQSRALALPPVVAAQPWSQLDSRERSDELREHLAEQNHLLACQRLSSIARLRGMLPHLTGQERANCAGDLAELSAHVDMSRF